MAVPSTAASSSLLVRVAVASSCLQLAFGSLTGSVEGFVGKKRVLRWFLAVSFSLGQESQWRKRESCLCNPERQLHPHSAPPPHCV